MERIIMDVDTALGIAGGDIDDAHAIALVAAQVERSSLMGITVVGGNVTLESGFRSTRLVCDQLGLEVPIACGAQGPADRPLKTGHSLVLQSDQIAEQWIFDHEPEGQPYARPAWDFIAEVAAGGPLTLLATAPLTNIARFLDEYPELAGRITRIVNMGGWYLAENRGPEFNILVDPVSACRVYQSGIPIVIAPLEMTTRALMQLEEIEPWKEHGRAGEVFYTGTRDWIEKLAQMRLLEGCHLHDPLAVGYYLWPELFETRGIVPSIDRRSGFTEVIGLDDDSPVRLITDYDLPAFKAAYHRSMLLALEKAALVQSGK